MSEFRTTLRFLPISKTSSESSVQAHPRGVVLFSETEFKEMEQICVELTAGTEKYFETNQLTSAQRYYIATLRMLGAISISQIDGNSVRIVRSGKIAAQLPKILTYYLKNQYIMIDDWSRLILNEDHLSAAEIVNELEYRRVLQDQARGVQSVSFDSRPSAFAIICALNKRGERAYLFELNKDWNRYNLIGGKQTESDRGSYEETVRREITEELGISRDRIRLYRLNETPMEGRAISANAGGLTSYPCVLFGCVISGKIEPRLKDRWIAERDVMAIATAEPRRTELMVNPDYLSFLLDGKSSVLQSVPISTQNRVETIPLLSEEDKRGWRGVLSRWYRAANDNKDLIGVVATTTMAITSIITLFLV